MPNRTSTKNDAATADRTEYAQKLVAELSSLLLFAVVICGVLGVLTVVAIAL